MTVGGKFALVGGTLTLGSLAGNSFVGAHNGNIKSYDERTSALPLFGLAGLGIGGFCAVSNRGTAGAVAALLGVGFFVGGALSEPPSSTFYE